MYKKNMKQYLWMNCALWLSLFPIAAQAYDLPPPEQRHKAWAKDMTVSNAMFLRDKTITSIIGTLIKKERGYELADDAQKTSGRIPVEVDPSIKIGSDLNGKKVRAVGRMTYKTMYFPDMKVEDGPAYSFKFELYAVDAVD